MVRRKSNAQLYRSYCAYHEKGNFYARPYDNITFLTLFRKTTSDKQYTKHFEGNKWVGTKEKRERGWWITVEREEEEIAIDE